MSRLVRVLRRVFAILGLCVISYGLALPTSGSQGRWLACLGLGGLLIGIGIWPSASVFNDRASRPVINVVMTMALVFDLLGVQMARVQVLNGSSIASRSGEDPASGDVLSNPRSVNADLRTHRGSIVDRNGVVLAESVRHNGMYDRRYPIASASYVCGYFSPLKYGKAGLEATYDDVLSGEDTGNPLTTEIDRLLGRDRGGAEVRLTIDALLQERAHALLGDRTGSVVVIDVQTGAVLVLASNPHVDPGQLVAIDAESAEAAAGYWDSLNANPSRPLLVRATDGLYTPGSTFKIVTASAAIDSGNAQPDDVYRDDGQLDVDGHVIVEQNRPDDTIDQWTLTQGLAFSLNVVFAQVGLEIGADTLAKYAERFGFGEKIPFDVPVSTGQVASSPGFLESPAALADTAFGQGQLLATPLGMALVAAGIANGGKIMAPYLVDGVVDADGDVIESANPSVWRTPVSEETAGLVRDMMIAAVEQGYAGGAAIDGLVIGGKTGTAETGSGDPHAWFIGFVGGPAPRYAIAVVLEHGGSGTHEPIGIARAMLAAVMSRPE